MNAFLTLRGRRFLPLLAMGCVLVGSPASVRADRLTSRLTDTATLTSTNSSAGLAVRVVYESQGSVESRGHTTPSRDRAALAAALILVVPAGTTPMQTTPVPPPPPVQIAKVPPTPDVPPPSGPEPNGPPTNGSPEPGSLVLALTGSGAAIFAWLRRRRRHMQPAALS